MSTSRVRRLRLCGAAVAALLCIGLPVATAWGADSDAPKGAPHHWLPSEPWVMHHWLPYDERRLERILAIDRADLWRILRSDVRPLARHARRRGWNPRRLAAALVAPRRSSVSKRKLAVLRARAYRTLTQAHLARHMFFHPLHEWSIPDHAKQLFGVRSKRELARLRRLELSPQYICRLSNRSYRRTLDRAAAVLRRAGARGARSGDTSARQAQLQFERQLRGLPRWMRQSAYGGPPATEQDGDVAKPIEGFQGHAALADGARTLAYELSERAQRPSRKERTSVVVRSTDVQGHTTERIFRAGGKGSTRGPSLSADGRVLAYETQPRKLGYSAGELNGVVVRDLQDGTAWSVDSEGRAGRRTRSSSSPSVSADGKAVVFESLRRRGRSPDYRSRVFVHRVDARQTTWLRPDSQTASDMSEPDVSGDGRFVVFSASARSGGPLLVWRRDTTDGSTGLVSRGDGPSGPPANGESFEPRISADGRYVAFSSSATNLSAGSPGINVYVRDVALGQTVAVRAGTRGGSTLQPEISADGRRVALVELSLRSGRIEGSRVLVAEVATQLPLLPDIGLSSRFSLSPAMSHDGGFVAFAADRGSPSHRKTRPRRTVLVRALAPGQ